MVVLMLENKSVICSEDVIYWSLRQVDLSISSNAEKSDSNSADFYVWMKLIECWIWVSR